MSKFLIFSLLGVAFADWDTTVTEVVTKTATVCPCDTSTAWAGWNEWSSPETRCYTLMDTKPAPYATQWATTYTPCTSTITTTTDVTKSWPESKTVTSTVTTTVTGTTETETCKKTITNTDTTTSTVTTVTTTTDTSTSTSTTTVSASAGFTPVLSSLPGSSYSGSGGVAPVKREAWSSTNGTFSPFGDFKYPKAVSCVHWVEDECKPDTATVTNTHHEYPCTTYTTTTTLTSTVYPHATTTSTYTDTTTITATTTTTLTTSTQTTTTAAGPTLYAVCGKNNMADTVSGNRIVGGTKNGDTPSGVSVTTADNAYDCCVAGLNSASTMNVNTAVTVFGDGTCILLTEDTCTTQGANTYQAVYDTQGDQFTLSNLYCGEVTTSASIDAGV